MHEWTIFDFDGTIIRGDSTLPLVVALAKARPWRVPAAVVSAMRMRMAKSPQDLQAMKCELIGSLLCGLPLSVVCSAAAETADRIRRRAHPDVSTRLRSLVDSGEPVLVASASPSLLLREYFRNHPRIQIVATEFEVENGRYSGRLRGVPCFGVNKLAAIEVALGPSAAVRECWSDSSSDLPMMRLGRERRWVASEHERRHITTVDPDASFIDP